MTDAVPILVCASGAAWELPLVRALQRPELGVAVVRRCVDHGELLGTALRDRPRAVVVDGALGWVDRDFVASMRRAGVEVIAIGGTGRDLQALAVHQLPGDVPGEAVAAVVHGLEPEAARPPTPVDDHGASTGRVLAVWGGPGSPGRTAVAVHLAVESALGGRTTLLLDADVWAGSVAQTLGLAESPSLTQAARAAAEGGSEPLAAYVQDAPRGLRVLAGLPRAELWPEVREEAWRAVIARARAEYEVVVVDLAAPLEEDEELVFDRVPYRRNLVTTVALELADRVVQVVAADPVGLRRGIVAHRTLSGRSWYRPACTAVALNRAPSSSRRLQECSRAVAEWMGAPPAALLGCEPALDRVVWEGRPLHDVAPRSPWLRDLRASVPELVG